jgi:hypothetical protein
LKNAANGTKKNWWSGVGRAGRERNSQKENHHLICERCEEGIADVAEENKGGKKDKTLNMTLGSRQLPNSAIPIDVPLCCHVFQIHLFPFVISSSPSSCSSSSPPPPPPPLHHFSHIQSNNHNLVTVAIVVMYSMHVFSLIPLLPAINNILNFLRGLTKGFSLYVNICQYVQKHFA